MELEAIYPICRAILGKRVWAGTIGGPGARSDPETVPLRLAEDAARERVPAYIADLAALEWAVHSTGARAWPTGEAEETILNPTLSLVTARWKTLVDLLESSAKPAREPEPGEEHVLVWRMPDTGEIRIRAATHEDLLVLKMVEERIEARTVAASGGLPIRSIHDAIDRACANGLVISPPTRIRRGDDFVTDDGSRAYMDARVFTLQWHLTQRCELACRHCYDRTDRREIPLERSLAILDDLGRFCETKHVRGAVTFTGGNPLLYPHFTTLYRAAADHGFATAILGNPTGKAVIEGLLDVAKPDFFQVSLEGLETHNDRMRGPGHFRRTLAFLEVLRDLGVYSMVMLTLTEGNLKEVLPLAQSLMGLTDVFHFNRLSRSGMGADLFLPSREEYRSFLKEYVAASKENPVMGLKDNLLNLVLTEKGEPPFGGCTGFGCGAAFNFVTLLPDGEVHACRKFPSPLGNILQASLSEIYDSEGASRYRQRPAGCKGCALTAACGGCLAVVQTHGLDVSKDRDPFCFR